MADRDGQVQEKERLLRDRDSLMDHREHKIEELEAIFKDREQDFRRLEVAEGENYSMKATIAQLSRDN